LALNEPLLEFWNATKYVISWLKAGHHSALDNQHGQAKNDVELDHRAKLFV
jgi:hypothetical protein